ncbi:ABC transporter permease [Enterococcus sp. AZ103]|uniref:ABC transporter permease n=1 Tax=Enterococcus sp. AZ103 TaxID=2774628 RepID=UPI003F26DE77
MLLKLSLSGMKNRLRDYLVLFSGLVVAAGIFYMFEILASNEAFLKSNSTISAVVFIFHLGSILLGIITLVYILYANSFLMTMRQRDYGLFMMLGAKSRKIAQLIFLETFFVGIAATIVGVLLGIGLAAGVNQLLVHQLNLTVSHFSPVHFSAFLTTLIFFVIIFFVAAILNATKIVKLPILNLLKDADTPVQVKRSKLLLFVETLAGIALLGIGYFMMFKVMNFGIFALVIALVTIVLGTYFVFDGVIIFIISLLKRSANLALNKLNNFTLAQLTFRLKDYTKMLSMVAMIFALALGAVTVGLGFHKEITKMTEATNTYDLVLNNSQKVAQGQVRKLQPISNTSYQMKETADSVYFIQSEFNQTPLKVVEMKEAGDFTKSEYSGDRLATDVTASDQLRNLELPSQRSKNQVFLSESDFAALPENTSSLQLIQVKDFSTSLEKIADLVALNQKNNPELSGDNNLSLSQKYDAYTVYNSLFSGFEFMGFFLGLAFLTMLASCLMFKILSGAASDAIRYQMLNKIGARRNLLQSALKKEIGILFLVPGILGIFHVLFGLQMFKSLLQQPYQGIWLPFLIFTVLYILYYFLTVWLYSGIVLPKEKNS